MRISVVEALDEATEASQLTAQIIHMLVVHTGWSSQLSALSSQLWLQPLEEGKQLQEL